MRSDPISRYGTKKDYGSLPYPTPEWALVDLLWAHGGWNGFGLGSDDVDLDEADHDVLRQACETLKVDIELIFPGGEAPSFMR